VTIVEHLARRALTLVTGKGGVGKSVVAAALGRLLAGDGHDTLLLEVDPRESLHELTATPPSGGEVVRVAPHLRLQHVPPREVIEATVRDHLKVDMLVKRVTRSPVFAHFVEAAPGLDALAVLGHAWRIHEGMAGRALSGIDTIVLDAPASGHGLSMLGAPAAVAEVIDSGPFGEMAANLRGFVADPDRLALVVVTHAEEMPVTETLELLDGLAGRLDRAPDLIVVNAVYPEFEAHGLPEAAARLWRERRRMNDRELARLARHWDGPLAVVPLLARDRGPALVREIAEHLSRVPATARGVAHAR
jgi:anion-transporting  ArsA/GET3 family ATPase